MGKTEYRLMTLSTVADMLNETSIDMNRYVMRDGFAINLDMAKSRANSLLLSRIMVPFQVKDYRMLRVISGKGRMEINFTDYDLAAGDIILIKEDSYFQIKEISDDMCGEVVAFAPDRFQLPMPLMTPRFVRIHPDSQDWDEIGHMFYTAYLLAQHEPFRSEAVASVVHALINDILSISRASSLDVPVSSKEYIFSRFIEELTNNRLGKQPVSHYADRLCITPQYLSKVVSEASGRTVSEWIAKAVVLDAKILLRDASKTVSEISDALNFPNDSFFCRFFRRETGRTPTQYRKEL